MTLGPNSTVTFGKHKGKTYKEICQGFPSYGRWILRGDQRDVQDETRDPALRAFLSKRIDLIARLLNDPDSIEDDLREFSAQNALPEATFTCPNEECMARQRVDFQQQMEIVKTWEPEK